MNEPLVSSKTALLAKTKGFDWKVLNYLNDREFSPSQDDVGSLENYNRKNPYWDELNYYSVPTQSLLQKWLREVHDIHLWVKKRIVCGDYTEYEVNLQKGHKHANNYHNYYKTYEEALEIGLKEALNLIP